MSNQRVLYITRIQEGRNHILNKVFAQVQGLEKLGYDVDIIYLNRNRELIYNDEVISKFKANFSIHLLFFNHLTKYVDLQPYDYCFIRNPFILNQYNYIKFLEKLVRNSIKIILEIPTYPYKKELNGFSQKVIYQLEKLTRKKLKKYISLILYSGNSYDKIYNITAFNLTNVGNASELPLSNSESNKNSINLVGVSSCKDYHGYDRVIKGLDKFYKSDPETFVYFHIIGYGPKLNEYKKLIDLYSLENKVIIHGKKYGEELDALMDEMDVGISCLGMHRIGLEAGSPLKTTEYAIRGLPLVLSYKDTFFSGCEFTYNIASNDEPLNILTLREWYKTNQFNNEVISEYTIQNTSWESQFKKVIDLVEST